MDSEAQQRDDITGLPALLRTVRRRLAIVLVCVIVLPAAAFVFSKAQQNEYTATASLLFRDPQFDQKLFGSTVFQPTTDPAREAATNVKLVSLEVVAARTSKALGGHPTPAEVSSAVTVSPAGQSDVANIQAVDHDPAFAAKLVNTFAQQFIAFRRDADRSKIASAEGLVQSQLSGLSPALRAGRQGTVLRQHSDELKILAALQTGNAELVQPAQTPSSASSPQPVRNAAIGLLLGLLVGVGIAILLE